VPYLGHSRRRERQCYPNGQKSKIPFGCIVNFVAPMIMSVPARNNLRHLTEILTINPSLLPTCSFCLHGDPTDSPSTWSSAAARTPVASRPKVLFIAMEAYLVVPARQFKPWRVLLDRDDNVLEHLSEIISEKRTERRLFGGRSSRRSERDKDAG
jgi:hypothetical protein